jgi:hypothetical protein
MGELCIFILEREKGSTTVTPKMASHIHSMITYAPLT